MTALQFERLMQKIFDCGMRVSNFMHFTEEEINRVKNALSIRRPGAYGLNVSDGKLVIDLYKGDDPAGLASADTFNHCSRSTIDFLKAKAVVAYAISIANSLITNYCSSLHDPQDYNLMDKYLQDVYRAQNCDELFGVLEDYKNNFLSRFEACFCPEY